MFERPIKPRITVGRAVAVLALLWVVISGTVAVLSQSGPSKPSEADLQAAAGSMRTADSYEAYDIKLMPEDAYVDQLRQVLPKCLEPLTQVVEIFKSAAARQRRIRDHTNITSYAMLAAYNAETSQRVATSNCTDEVSALEPFLAN